MGQVAILGGTFDPVHWGHLLVAQSALDQLSLDQVIWVPATRPPHKHGLAYEHRRLMVEMAIADNPAFVLSPMEFTQTSPDYAIKTLTHLQDNYPKSQWYWVIGLDAFQTLPRWYCREKLIPACDWLVAPRSVSVTSTGAVCVERASQYQEVDPQHLWRCQHIVGQLAAQNISIRWQLLQMPLVSISSSLIRQYCRQRRSIRYLVPEAVQAYITTHKLYLD